MQHMAMTEFVHAGGLDVAYNQTGAGPPFVMVHGFTGSKLDFQNQLPWFADTRQVIAPDNRGHGETSHAGPYTIAQLVEDLTAFLDALGLIRVDLLGHSMGGMAAMRFAIDNPERVRSLVLMDTSPGPMEMANPGMRDMLAKTVREKGCAALVPMMKLQPQDEIRTRGVDYLGKAEHWRRITVKLEQLDPEAFIAFAGELASHADATDQLNQIICPTTVIVGKHDQPFLTPAKVLAQRIPEAVLVEIAQAAHNPQYENHEDWRAAIEQHLSR